jgi:cell division protease FtsH
VKIFKKIEELFKTLSPRRILVGASVFSVIMIAVGGMGLNNLLNGQKPPTQVAEMKKTETVDFTEFLKLVDGNRIKKVDFAATTLTATDTSGDTFVLNHDRRFGDESFPQELARKGIVVDFPNPNRTSPFDYVMMAIQLAMQLLVMAVFVGMGAFLFMNAKRLVNPSWPTVAKNVPVRFSNVAGQEESKFELEEIKTFLLSPEAYRKSGAKPPRGVLLVGPPGTGKTMLAEALAGETGVSFIAVTGSDFSNAFVGTGRDRVEKLFKRARKSAPCIVFIDEIDSLARARSGGGSDVSREHDTTLNQLLTEMNGFGKREGVIVVGATNRIELLDEAVLRPGRFDRHVFIGLPDVADRELIIDVHMKGKKPAADVDLKRVARGTPGSSGADLENLINEAATLAARRGSETLSMSDFEEARDKVLMGAKKTSGMLDDYERKLAAYHEAGHAVVATVSKNADPVHQATIIPRAKSLGHVMQVPEKDWKAVPMSRFVSKLDILVAGRIAEELVFGKDEVTSGAASDIEEATKIATAMVTVYGMSDVIGMQRIVPSQTGFDEGVKTEIKRKIDDACERVRTLLRERSGDLEAVAAALLDRETLTGADIRALVAA